MQAILDSGRTVGIVGMIGLTFTGIGWVEAIRSSQRLIWRLNEQPGYIGVRQALDLLVLIGVLLLLALSQLAVYGAGAAARLAGRRRVAPAVGGQPGCSRSRSTCCWPRRCWPRCPGCG